MNIEQKNNLAQIVTSIASLFLILGFIKLSSEIVTPFILSVFISILLYPVLQYMNAIKIPRSLSIFMIVLVLMFLIFLVGANSVSAAKSLHQKIPEYISVLNKYLSNIISLVNDNFDLHISIEGLFSNFDFLYPVKFASTLVSGFGSFMKEFFFVTLLVSFMLFEAPLLSKKIYLSFTNPEDKIKKINNFFQLVNNYVAIKTIIGLITGFIIGFLLWLCNIDFYILWGLIAFFLNYIPNIGSILASIPPLFVSFAQQGMSGLFKVLIIYSVVNVVMGNIIEPRFMGEKLGLSTLVVFLSLVFWGWILGGVGMLLSVPLTIVIKIALESSSYSFSRPVYVFLSSERNSK